MVKKIILNDCFNSNNYPGYETKVEIANSIRLTIKQVEDWFKQKRYYN